MDTDAKAGEVDLGKPCLKGLTACPSVFIGVIHG